MTASAFAWFLLLLLASRVTLLGQDAPLTRSQALLLTLGPGLALAAATPTLGIASLFAVILAANLGGAWLEHRHPWRIPGYRLLTLAVILLAAGFAYAPVGAVTLRPAVQAAGTWLADHSLYLGARPLNVRPLLRCAGALLVINEANLLIRLILQALKVTPRQSGGDAAATAPSSDGLIILPPSLAAAETRPLDQREYNTGRFIGVLERLLVYVLVLEGQYEAIGLILAAKSFARFRELDQREFAEYVLIGTLLSVGAAVAVGEGVKALLP